MVFLTICRVFVNREGALDALKAGLYRMGLYTTLKRRGFAQEPKASSRLKVPGSRSERRLSNSVRLLKQDQVPVLLFLNNLI